MTQCRDEQVPCFAPVDIAVVHGDDRAITLANRIPLGTYPDSLIHFLRHFATHRPDAVFLGERQGGHWFTRTYADVWARSGALAARLLGAECSALRPLMILADNSIDHAELTLAALRVGVPVAPVSLSNATKSLDFDRLRYMTDLLTPGSLFVIDPVALDAAITALGNRVGRIITPANIDDLPVADGDIVAAAERRVSADTVAKLLFTSGSTGKPKAVINTHRMLVSNQAALALIWPCLGQRPPVILDWLPWNHTFGGNFTFNMALYHGGSYFIDDGKPLPKLIERTVQNLREISPTLYFNVPAGYDALMPHLAADKTLARRFLGAVDFLFSAGAALPQKARDQLGALAMETVGKPVPMFTGWGSTETAPCCTATYFDTDFAPNIGAPLPGTEVRLTPLYGKLELRVKGPNIMPGYWRDAAATAAAFDADGFYRMGDAGRLVVPEDPSQGIAFDGRVAENFKLRSGTWVNVGALRLEAIDCARPLIRDVVVTGHDSDELGLLVFPNVTACRELTDCDDDYVAITHPSVMARLRRCFAEHNKASHGGSTRIARFRIQILPPSAETFEITDKGYINQRAVLDQRAEEVRLLHSVDSHRV